MNDRGKSDSRVVPAKLANKTGQPAAELVEERRLTKGNTDQHNASRTQIRAVMLTRPVRWDVCAELHSRTGKRGSQRCFTTSRWIVCGQPMGRGTQGQLRAQT